MNPNDFLNEQTSITVNQDETMTPSPKMTSINYDILMDTFDLSTNYLSFDNIFEDPEKDDIVQPTNVMVNVGFIDQPMEVASEATSSEP